MAKELQLGALPALAEHKTGTQGAEAGEAVAASAAVMMMASQEEGVAVAVEIVVAAVAVNQAVVHAIDAVKKATLVVIAPVILMEEVAAVAAVLAINVAKKVTSAETVPMQMLAQALEAVLEVEGESVVVEAAAMAMALIATVEIMVVAVLVTGTVVREPVAAAAGMTPQLAVVLMRGEVVMLSQTPVVAAAAGEEMTRVQLEVAMPGAAQLQQNPNLKPLHGTQPISPNSQLQTHGAAVTPRASLRPQVEAAGAEAAEAVAAGEPP